MVSKQFLALGLGAKTATTPTVKKGINGVKTLILVHPLQEFKSAN